jgi:hypothetical protein
MWAFSTAARAELAGDHAAVSKVEVWHSGRPSYVLDVVSGSVSVDADRSVRRNLTAMLVDPTGELTEGDVGDLLNPYECEIAPYRGVVVGGIEEFAPLGVFGLTSRPVSDGDGGLSISISGQDRAMQYQGPMKSSLSISAGTPVEEAVALLLATRNAGLTLDAMVTGFTCGPLLFAPDIDVWGEAQELAASVGAVLFHDRTGQARLTLAGPVSDTPVAEFSEGGGRLVDVDRTEDSDTIRNVVVVESANGLIRATAEDLNTASPTYSRGRYGRRPVTIVNQHVGSVEQAQQAAATRLVYELGRSETVSFTAVPHPGLDVQEVVTVHRPRVGLERRALVVATLDMPLGVGEAMKVGCRKSVLAQDGEVLPVTAITG